MGQTNPILILQAYAPKTYKFFAGIVGEEKVHLQLVKIGYCFYRGNPGTK